ncbi:MAG: hypothetical protein ACREL5_01965 [Gemmatimonadales bacterium]
MSTAHLTMEQLLVLRDCDRSEPGLEQVQSHFAECGHCQSELERLHQRTARLRALPTLMPAQNRFPAVRERLTVARHRRRVRTGAWVGFAAATALVATVIGPAIVHPPRLDAEQQIKTEMDRSRELEQTLNAWHPEQRMTDGRTAVVVIQLENRIADLDARIAQTERRDNNRQLKQELELWQERVGLMNALLDVHLTNASNVGL